MRIKRLIFRGFFLLAFLLLCETSYCDCIKIPFPCYPKEIQKKFAKAGKQLDLSGSDRTEKSWGFIDNKGTQYDIITYAPIEIKDLNEIQKIVMEE